MMRVLPLVALLLVVPVAAQEPTAWQDQKCALYADAWNRALDSLGTDDINYNFLAINENFIASGCTDTAAACPGSDEERQIADMLTVVMMNEGAASTFLPFRCPVADEAAGDSAVDPAAVDPAMDE